MRPPAARIDGRTHLYGLLGHPIEGSLSPAMHNAAFQALGLNGVYVPFPVQPVHLKPAVEGLCKAGLRGFNLTLPHKVDILPLLDEITPEARAIGAVNTVRHEDGRLSGTNTDGVGFLAALEADLSYSPAGKTVLVLGAGGAARGIAYALLNAGVTTLHIANRTAARAEALRTDCTTRFPAAAVYDVDWAHVETLSPDLLVNTTTVGMGGEGQPVDLSRLRVRGAVVDIVYHPLETPLLAQARSLGVPHANGLGMLLYQGAAAFRFWLDREPPVDVMHEALASAMGE